MIREEELDALLRGAPWMPQDGRAADRYERVDHAVLGSAALLLIVAAVGGPASGRRFFVPVRADDEGRPQEAHGSDAFDVATVTRTLSGGRLHTARGGTIEFRGPGGPAAEVRRLPFQQGWSSNALSLVDVAGTPCIHKTYRRLDEPVHEPELLRRMNGTGRTPQWIGDYAYVHPSDGVRRPLGVIYRYAPGDGIDVPLRENLRSLWPRLGQRDDADETLVREHLRPMEEQLSRAGEFLYAFHRDLAGRLPGAAVYPVGAALERAARRVDVLEDEDGMTLPPHARTAAFAALRAELFLLEGEFEGRGPLPGAAPCHGDLHLSHLLCERDGTDWRMSVIDLSTPALSPADPGGAEQSPLQDLVAVQRALEYFAADEAAFESARRLGVDSLETMLGALDGAPHLSASRQAVLRRVFAVADAWRERVLRLLLGTAAASPLSRLLYVRRLLHELAYNQAHARPYHAAIDLRHARALAPTAAFARK
ncbi:hypothetical protein [Streptomyces sp. VRA16 Mangrove soil]|uniref:hypothetical protein n=1 Tax=Streptomyces sp. VRA16 Mangrove soil TaxID=2817434 RepID=UPI001A9E181A|nr:hypothetical protein [Streptomyces sp. VRA16 Mangrove soil]MBO1334465.1 hypothetical protein [Streptomyces sp. VRA16 Mangrove soil]